MEAVQPPLFLRFINLLMNDAVYLLDEALSNMAQLRQMLQARYSLNIHHIMIIFYHIVRVCIIFFKSIKYFIINLH